MSIFCYITVRFRAKIANAIFRFIDGVLARVPFDFGQLWDYRNLHEPGCPMVKARRYIDWVMRALLALSLLSISSFHNSRMTGVDSLAVYAQYGLPDGTIGDICFGTDGVHRDDHQRLPGGAFPVCDYCRLAVSALLPAPPDESYLIVRTALAGGAPGASVHIILARSLHLPQSRAPPVLG